MIGRTLAHYRIVEKIGAGGMGEVYRATDTRLGRDVAVKLLPEAFARDAERLSRFEQEARLLATLNHPHIAAIYGLEEAEGVRFLALELVPGVTLAEHIGRSPLPVEEALRLAAQIAAALEAAHEKGIIHRDLKPANVKVTPEGRVKVLDFGLAKVSVAEGEVNDLSQSPTMTAAATRTGVILGTAAYMSPEQARGHRVDRRTDVWAFGCVLFEMLTGRRSFAGETVSDCIAHILAREPDWSLMPEALPASVRRLLRRCLEKNAERRLRDLRDARLEIEETLQTPVGEAGPEAPAGAAVAVGPAAARLAGTGRARSWRAPLLASILTALGMVAIAATYLSLGRPAHPADVRVRRLTLMLPPETPLPDAGANLSLSPDGSSLVYVAGYGKTTRIYTRALDRSDVTAHPGTDTAHVVSLSPDGRAIAFVGDDKLRRIALSGGAPIVLADSEMPSVPAWTSDDTIIYTQFYNSGLFRIPANGGTPVTLTTPDRAKGELGHWHPFLLPGERSLLFTIWRKGGLPAAQVALLDLTTGKYRVLIDGGFGGRYARSGHLVYATPGTLMAAPFDAGAGKLTGEPVTVVDGLVTDPTNALPFFSIGDDGTLVYLAAGAATTRMMWEETSGPGRPITEERRGFKNPAVSPDGRRIAVSIFEAGSADIWMLDTARGVLTRLTSSPRFEFMPRWSPDGRRLVFITDTGAFTLYGMPVDGSAPPELLWESPWDMYPGSFSPDGRILAYTQNTTTTRSDLWFLDLEGEKKARAFLETEFDESNPEFSPDGRTLAFMSDESGEVEIYVAPVSNAGARTRVSTGGGRDPLWARDGKRLIYRSGSTLMEVSMQPGVDPAPGAPTPLLTDANMLEGWGGFRNWDLAPDGRRFVIVQGAERGGAPTPVNVVLNWFEELKRRVPVAKP